MVKALRFWTMAAVAALAALSAAPARGQTPAGATAGGAAPSDYVTPRTPWGDPDLQGNYTNVYEQGTPLERPEAFAGRTLADVQGKELAELKRGVQERTIARFEGPIHGPDGWWQTALFLERGSQAWFVVDPPDGRIPPLTDEARRRNAERAEVRRLSGRGPADSYEDRSLYDRCITRGLPTSMMPTIYGNSHRIIQGPGFVAIQDEMVHETRLIPVSGNRSHVADAIELDMGDSIGHWEGDTLVVETTNFNPRSTYRNANADTLTIVERFRRTSPDQVRWTVTIDDPSTWTRPWTYTLPLTSNEDEPLMPYECHEGNYGLRNILSGARADDQKLARGESVSSPTEAEDGTAGR